MNQFQKMALKPQAKLVTRLFLSPILKQNLSVLSYNSYDLIKMMKQAAASNPLIELKMPQANGEMQQLDWLADNNSETLLDHLLNQLNLMIMPEKERKSIIFLIYHLDNDGYLRTDLHKLANQSSYSYADLKAGLATLHTFEPLGIAAKDLNECLLLQCEAKSNFDEVARQILRQHDLELMADQTQWSKLPFSQAQIMGALTAIRTLNPSPASEYQLETTIQYLIPDLLYSWKNKELLVTDNQNQLPELVFDQTDYQRFKQLDQESCDYLLKQEKTYQDLTLAIQRRTKTLLRIGQYLGQKQASFFLSGDLADLVPLGLKDVAQALDLAPSTISRGIKDKYFEFQGQVRELKLLLPRSTVGDLSKYEFRNKVKEMLADEDPANPLSDQEIVERLKNEKIKASRRLVAKWRQENGIPNSYQRKTSQGK